MLARRFTPVRAALVALLASCGSLSVPSVPRAGFVPEVSFDTSDGTELALTSYRTTSDVAPQLLVVRVVAAWCGACQWIAENGGSLVPPALADRVRTLDVLVAGADNDGPPTPAELAAWSGRSAGTARSVGDGAFRLASLFPARAALPYVALVDTRTMRCIATLVAPTADAYTNAILTAFAALDGADSPAPAAHALVDGRFTRDQWALVQKMALTSTTDPTNAHEADRGAIALGKELFFDGDLSPSDKHVSCASCHAPDQHFQDGKPRASEGVGPGSRNVPTVILAADQRSLFWDGRADSAWSQALMPIEDPNEMASSRLYVAHLVRRKYAGTYEAVFGGLPPLDEVRRFPLAGKPHEGAWEDMSEGDRTLVNRVFSNVGKALAAYEHSLRPLPNALDLYAGGDLDALTGPEKDGLAAFLAAGCAQCHHGPRLTDDAFHALRFPTGRPDRAADRGRSDGIAKLLASEFLRSSIFSDAPSPIPAAAPSPASHAVGAFKTPGLRGVAFTLPYGHGGSFGGLTSTIDAHRVPLASDNPAAVGKAERWLVDFDAALTPKIVAFLKVLRCDLPR